MMFKAERNKEKEAKSLIKAHARKGLEKELDKLERNINKVSDKLLQATDSNSTVKRRSNMRTNLSLLCEEQDRIKLALELLESL